MRRHNRLKTIILIGIVLVGRCPGVICPGSQLSEGGHCPGAIIWGQFSKARIVRRQLSSGNCLGGNCPEGNYPRVQLPEGELSGGNCPWWQLSRVAIIQGGIVLFSVWEQLSGGNCLGGNCPRWQLSGRQLSRGELSYFFIIRFSVLEYISRMKVRKTTNNFLQHNLLHWKFIYQVISFICISSFTGNVFCSMKSTFNWFALNLFITFRCIARTYNEVTHIQIYDFFLHKTRTN